MERGLVVPVVRLDLRTTVREPEIKRKSETELGTRKAYC